MKAARIFVLGAALAAGGATAYFIGPGVERKPQTSLAKNTISALTSTVQGLFGVDSITADGTTKRMVFAPVVAPTNA
jgi:hypothetical protein